jgi:hypothetical protein
VYNYTKGTTKLEKVERKKKSLKLIDKGDIYAAIQKYKVSKNKDIISAIDLSLSSKFLSFISFFKHQKRHVGTIFHTATLLGLPKDH